MPAVVDGNVTVASSARRQALSFCRGAAVLAGLEGHGDDPAVGFDRVLVNLDLGCEPFVPNRRGRRRIGLASGWAAPFAVGVEHPRGHPIHYMKWL